MSRRIVTEADIHPKHKVINDYLAGDFQQALASEGLKYAHAPWREIKTGKLYDDRIYSPRDGFLANLLKGAELVADMSRSIDGDPALEIRVLNQDYTEALQRVAEQAKQYDAVSVTMR